MTKQEQHKSPLRAILIAILAAMIIIPALVYGFAYFVFWRHITPDITAEESEQASIAISDFLNNKYGNRNFTVEGVRIDGYDKGFSGTERTGYTAYVSSDDVNRFIVFTEGNKADTTKVTQEDYVERYYENDLPNAFTDNETLSSRIKVDSSVIPDDYGRFPKLNELLELGAVENIDITHNKKTESNSEYGLQPNLVKDVTSQLASFYGITASFHYNYHYYNPESDKYVECPIVVNESTIDIDTGDDGLITIGR